MATKKDSSFSKVLREDKSDAEEPYFSTDFSDQELDIIYKRYKTALHDNKIKMADLHEQAKEIFSTQQAYETLKDEGEIDDSVAKIKSSEEYLNKITLLFESKKNRQKMNYWIEHQMAQIKLERQLDKVSLLDIYTPDDPMFKGDFPYEDVDNMKDDPSVPIEI